MLLSHSYSQRKYKKELKRYNKYVLENGVVDTDPTTSITSSPHVSHTLAAYDPISNLIWIIGGNNDLDSLYSYNTITQKLTLKRKNTTKSVIGNKLYNWCTTNAVIINNTMYFTV